MARGVERISGLEGARGWLAWSVVAAHIVNLMDVQKQFPKLWNVIIAGDQAVAVFIIISGFVITHMLLEGRESYGVYIVRRFFRIYPAYVVCLGLAVLASFLTYPALAGLPWGDAVAFGERAQANWLSFQTEFWPHLAAHLTLLHGAIPSNVLTNSQYMFLPPGWSLSLEWQFYLVAPMVVMLARNPRSAFWLCVVALVSFAMYRKGLFGVFILPSFLPGAALLFAVGIVTRLGFDKLPRLQRYPFALILLSAGAIFWHRDFAPLWVWVALTCYMRLERQEGVLHAALSSKVSEWFGARSYSTYLVHYPLIHLLMWGAIQAGLGYWQTVAGIVLLVPVLTLWASALLYSLVERPGIALGRSVAQWSLRSSTRA